MFWYHAKKEILCCLFQQSISNYLMKNFSFQSHYIRLKYRMISISTNFWYSLNYTNGYLLVWWIYHWYVWRNMNMNWKYSRRIWNEIYLFNIVFVVQFKSTLSAEDMIAIINWYIGVHQRYKMKCCLHIGRRKGCNYNHHLLLWICV